MAEHLDGRLAYIEDSTTSVGANGFADVRNLPNVPRTGAPRRHRHLVDQVDVLGILGALTAVAGTRSARVPEPRRPGWSSM